MEKLTWVYVEGVFDLFHSGHVNFLKAAREQGDRLIVALVSDQDVCTYKPAPIVSFEERKKVVVGDVTRFARLTVERKEQE